MTTYYVVQVQREKNGELCLAKLLTTKNLNSAKAHRKEVNSPLDICSHEEGSGCACSDYSAYIVSDEPQVQPLFKVSSFDSDQQRWFTELESSSRLEAIQKRDGLRQNGFWAIIVSEAEQAELRQFRSRVPFRVVPMMWGQPG